MKHTDGECQSCNQKLTQAHNELVVWFKSKKQGRPTMHIAWSYRDQASQDQAFAEGKTHKKFPDSPHNHTVDGNPCSLALDLFEQVNGVAKFSPSFYARLADECKSLGDPILWGGNFKSLGDADHFQYHDAL